MMRTSKGLLSGIAALATAAALVLAPAAAFAAGGPPPGHGHGGGKPGGGEETATNNLSVPTIFVGSVGFGLTAPAGEDVWTDLKPPDGTPTTNWPIDPAAYYYVQGQNSWQAAYELTTSATVTGKWGDNLTGTAKLMAGHPVRVEMGLTTNAALLQQGYTVVKLEPAMEDRNSAYGTKATVNQDGITYSAIPEDMVPRVWTSGAYLTINGDATQYSMPGEINATGAPVFGYNWRPTAAGTYTLTFHVPSASGVTIINGTDGLSISIEVTVTGGGGGGGGGGRH